MADFEDIIAAWDTPEAIARIHPTRRISEEAYWASGETQAQQVVDTINDVLGLPDRAPRVIDFGAGDGRVAIPMYRTGLKVLAVDSSREALNRLTEREPGIATYVSDGDHLADYFKGSDSQRADAVVCRAVLIHHSYKDVTRLVARFADVVRPGGLLIADWPTSDRPSERNDWIDVTTWDRSTRDEVAFRLGWEPLNADGDPSVWQRKHDKVDDVIEAVKESGGVRTEEIDDALPPNKVIREWAAENGHEVSARGKIPTDIITAYLDAHRDDVL